MKYLLIGFLRVYRALISPLYGNVCKYYPSCSAYALEAVTVHGAAKGSWLAGRRLGRCHPWSLGGYDPVPGTPAAAAWEAEQAEKAAQADMTTTTTGPEGPSQPEAAARPDACCPQVLA